MNKSLKPGLFLLLILCVVPFACKNMYFSATPRGESASFPGLNQPPTSSSRGQYPAYTGVVQVFESMDDLKGYNYETLSSLIEHNNDTTTRTRSEMIATLQRRAAQIGANAIAITDQRESIGDILLIRVNAVRVLDKKDSLR